MIFLRKRRRKIADEVGARLREEGIILADDSANCFGVESRGRGQIRGNGCLAASPSEIVFVMWLPRRELSIPRDRVVAVDRTTSHLRKSVGRDLLRVKFTNAAGEPDSVAWFVRDLAAWEFALGVR